MSNENGRRPRAVGAADGIERELRAIVQAAAVRPRPHNGGYHLPAGSSGVTLRLLLAATAVTLVAVAAVSYATLHGS